jgi:hypothetical protein
MPKHRINRVQAMNIQKNYRISVARNLETFTANCIDAGENSPVGMEILVIVGSTIACYNANSPQQESEPLRPIKNQLPAQQ